VQWIEYAIGERRQLLTLVVVVVVITISSIGSACTRSLALLLLLLGQRDGLGTRGGARHRGRAARLGAAGVQQRHQDQEHQVAGDLDGGEQDRLLARAQELEAVSAKDEERTLGEDREREGERDDDATQTTAQSPDPENEAGKGTDGDAVDKVQELAIERALERRERQEVVLGHEVHEHQHERHEASARERAQRVDHERQTGDALDDGKVSERRLAQHPEEVQGRHASSPRL